jgi:hypothetical protein
LKKRLKLSDKSNKEIKKLSNDEYTLVVKGQSVKGQAMSNNASCQVKSRLSRLRYLADEDFKLDKVEQQIQNRNNHPDA